MEKPTTPVEQIAPAQSASENALPTLPRYLVIGRLTRDTFVTANGQAFCDVPGGNALYAAVGAAVWEKEPPPALLARLGEDYPQEWLERFSQAGIDVSGVKILPEALENRFFAAFTDRSHYQSNDPVIHFARHGLAFPKNLLDYRNWLPTIDSRTRLLPTSLRQNEIADHFYDVGIAHIAPLDFLSHSLLPAAFRQASFTTITLDPSPAYMNPTFWGDVPSLLTGLTAFLPSEDEIRQLFHGRSSDLWEMAAALAAYGCEIIVIKRGENGQLLYDAPSRKRWEIPAYPSRFANPLGAGDAFCGGFLVGYRQTYDPLEAVLYGNISASLVVEGHAALYALEVLPGLPEARLESLRHAVRLI